MELTGGFRLVTDPFDPSTGYPVGHVRCDAVTVSHSHHDHSAVETVACSGPVYREAGSYQPAPDVRLTLLPSWHDDAQGAKRGPNLITLVESGGLRVLHLGDLGHMPDAELLRAMGQPDVLLIPVGGFFTIDAAQARELCGLLKPRVIVPMHYRTACNSTWPIAPLEDFLGMMPEEAERLSLLRVTKADLACQPRIAVLEPQCMED